MGALKDLWNSERGLLALAIIIASTVLTALDKMTIDAWQSMTLYIFGIYAAGKTITGAVGMITGKTADAPVTAPAAAPAPAAAATPTEEPTK